MAMDTAPPVFAENLQATEEKEDALKFEESETNSTCCNELKLSRTNNNNIHHVVPVGVLIVLFTLYLSALALHQNCENNSSKLRIPSDGEQEFLNAPDGIIENDRQCVLSRWTVSENDLPGTCMKLEDEQSKHAPETGKNNDDERAGSINEDANAEDNGNGKKPLARKLNNIKMNKKINSHKYHNKSSKAKLNGNKRNSRKKPPVEEPKKTSAAEPIIYLFALVFIYLLLKAASDINQHYKSKTKGDKRMRRCSLQSYAQTHRQDRRASKELALAKKHRHHFMEARSKSFDPHTNLTKSLDYIEKKKVILANLRKYTSVDEQSQMWSPNEQATPATAATTTTNELAFNLPHATSSAISNRRCSMPISTLTQMHPLSTYSIAPNTDRRMSMASFGSGSAINANTDGITYEVKRRVRMINRH